MTRDLSDVGLDSNCLSYVIQAMEGVTEPRDDLAEQKVALVRLYLGSHPLRRSGSARNHT